MAEAFKFEVVITRIAQAADTRKIEIALDETRITDALRASVKIKANGDELVRLGE